MLIVRRLFINPLLLLIFFCVAYTGTAQALDVKNIRFGLHSDKTRMVIELSDQTDFRSFMLPAIENKPHRVVVDLPPFNWDAGTIKRPASNVVTDIRSGELAAGIQRIVIDLAKPAKIKSAFIMPKSGSKPVRLVVDFETVSPAQFASAERKVFGTLRDDQAKLNLLISEQTLDSLEVPEKAASTVVRNTVTPPKKPIITNPPPTSPLRKPVIVIDAGHGGQDPGAIGVGREREKDITLSAARILKKKLQDTGRYSVSLTRDNDKYLKLYQRRAIAHQLDADLFISLHADSIRKSNVRGASIYTLSNKASDAQTAKLAARENQADLIAGVDLSHEDKEVANILIDLAMRDTMNQSKFFANTVVGAMKNKGIRLLERPHRYAGFAVLKSPDIPSVLFEMGFMSNRNDINLLRSPQYQEKLASALVSSIDHYFQKIQKNSVQ